MKFTDALARGGLIFDGAMGTALRDGFPPVGRCLEAANLDHPQRIRAIHEGFLEAGSRVLRTNTFQANRVRLALAGETERLEAINTAGVRLAREIAGDRALVAGSIGPATPPDVLDATVTARACGEQARILADSGADLVVLETFLSLRALLAALGAALETGLPVVALMALVSERSHERDPLDVIVGRLMAEGAAAAGLNCMSPDLVREMTLRVPGWRPGPLVLIPNAGPPTDHPDPKRKYPVTPPAMGRFGREAAALGVSVVGGCCGTTPDHIRALVATFPAGPPDDHGLQLL